MTDIGRKQEEALNKLIAVDSKHEIETLRAAFNGCQELLQNGSFIAIMRVIFEITGYDADPTKHVETRDDFVRMQGRKEVWCAIRDNLLGNNAHALSLIEHHKQINRHNNNV